MSDDEIRVLPPRDRSRYLRLARTVGANDIELILRRLREAGAYQSDSVVVLREAFGMSLADAKSLVDASPTWADHRDSNARLRERVLSVVLDETLDI